MDTYEGNMTALDLAIMFHEIYERRAPEFGYETRKETRAFNPDTPNGQLMCAVCGEIIDRLCVVTSLEQIAV